MWEREMHSEESKNNFFIDEWLNSQHGEAVNEVICFIFHF